MSGSSKGIVYVATKTERFVAEALLSASSAKVLMPDIPITLFTNLVDSVFARGDCFDEVIETDTIKAFDRRWSEGQLDRIRCLPNSPYDYTLHLDCDTRVHSAALATAFELLDRHDIAMVECDVDNSCSRECYGRPMFNVGFILFRKSESVMKLLEEWERLTYEFFQLARADDVPEVEFLAHIEDPDLRRKLLYMDQLSMVQLLSPEVNKFNVDCKILDESWNYRGSDSGRLAPTDLKVNHHPDLRNRYFSRDTVIAALRYQSAGDLDTSLDLLNWIDREQPGDIDIMKLLVLCRLQRQEYAEAGGALDRMLQQFPGYPWAESAKAKIEALTSGAAPSHPQS